MTAFLWTMLWQTALLALAAAALGMLLRRQPAAARHWLYFGALLLAAILPAASARLHLSVPRAAGPASVAVSTQAVPTVSAAAFPSRRSNPAPAQFPSLGLLLAGLWAGVTLLQAASLSRRWWRAHLAWRQAIPERMAAGVPVLRGAQGPFTLGWLRPRIVLPAALFESEPWTSAALAHELAHVRRRDYLWTWMSELALLPLAWHPAAHWLARQAALERETACDEAALAAEADYPTHLVDMVAALHLASARHAGVCLARRHDLEQRIARLLALPAAPSRARLLVCATALTLAAAGAWAVGGGLRVVAVPSPAATRQQTPQTIAVPVAAAVQEAMCIECKKPDYPPEAKAAGVQGTVEMHATIDENGSVTNLNCALGEPTLVAAAQDTVRQWRYHPLELNGKPVPVSTNITVTFSLDNVPAPPPIQGLRGQVCDEQGQRIDGATVQATAVDSGIIAQTTTAPDGGFAIDLIPGTYAVTVSGSGFQPRTQRVNLPLPHPLLLLIGGNHASMFVQVNARPQRK